MNDEETIHRIMQGGDEELRKLLDSDVIPSSARRLICAAVAMLRADRARFAASAAILYEACGTMLDELDDDSKAAQDVATAMEAAVRHECVKCRGM